MVAFDHEISSECIIAAKVLEPKVSLPYRTASSTGTANTITV